MRAVPVRICIGCGHGEGGKVDGGGGGADRNRARALLGNVVKLLPAGAALVSYFLPVVAKRKIIVG